VSLLETFGTSPVPAPAPSPPGNATDGGNKTVPLAGPSGLGEHEPSSNGNLRLRCKAIPGDNEGAYRCIPAKGKGNGTANMKRKFPLGRSALPPDFDCDEDGGCNQ
jgi:hypothetical protein